MSKSTSDYPRVLVVSHNSFSETRNNGKTMASFFSGWPQDRLAQFYIYDEFPDTTVCENFYRITDKEILSQNFNNHRCFRKKPFSSIGKEINKSTLFTSQDENSKQQEKHNRLTSFFYTIFKKRLSLAVWGRDYLWDKEFWKTKDLEQWLETFQPDVVFFQTSNYVFPYKIVNWICSKYRLPVVMQITDDYLTPGFSFDIFNWLHHIWLMKWFKKVFSQSYRVIAISDYLANEYRERFGGNYEVLMNSVPVPPLSVADLPSDDGKLKFVYAGGLGLNRWKVLFVLGKCLHELNEIGLKNSLEIYSHGLPSERVGDMLNLSPHIRYAGFLNREKLEQKFLEADVLVHVEAFDKASKRITRLSLSTKIPEYMMTGKCIFAIGPKDVASMRYLYDNGVAVVCTSQKENDVKAALMKIFRKDITLDLMAMNAHKLAVARHEETRAREVIRRVLSEAVSKSFFCAFDGQNDNDSVHPKFEHER